MKYAYKNGKILNGTKEMGPDRSYNPDGGRKHHGDCPGRIDHPQVKRNPIVTAELDKFLVD